MTGIPLVSGVTTSSSSSSSSSTIEIFLTLEKFLLAAREEETDSVLRSALGNIDQLDESIDRS